jgi:CBS domain-containing protein
MYVEDIMNCDVVTIAPSASLQEAIFILLQQKVGSLMVIEENKRIVGILTDGDLLRRVELGTEAHHRAWWIDYLINPVHSAEEYIKTHGQQVKDLMTTDVVSVTKNDPLQKVIDIMEHQHFKSLPVVEGDLLIGVINRSDLLQRIEKNLKQEKLNHSEDIFISDDKIQNTLLMELNKEPWFHNKSIHFTTQNGIITITGIIADVSERNAILVATKNIPGVKDVQDKMEYIPMIIGNFGP